jgi:aspartate/methionine/tyrosine aminotransferase
MGINIEPFKLERWMTTWETRVSHDIAESGICPLSVDDLLAFEPLEVRERLVASWLALPLGYAEARGSEALRCALAATYRDVSPEAVLVTTGAIEANFLLFATLLRPGDHVVAVHPAYQQLYTVPRALGCDVSHWEVRARDGEPFRYDLDDLERLVTPRTRLIVVNTPHNPTGALLSAEELRRVYDLADRVGAYLLCDEAYRWLDIPGGEPLAPPARDLGERAISVGTFSKPFGLPGLRVGWLAATPEIAAACWSTRDYVSLSPAKLSDAIALLALKHRERIVERNHRIVAANLETAEGWFAAHADLASWTPPRAGLLALMRYHLDLPSLELADRLAAEHGVMLAPGSAFGYEGNLRIGIGQDPRIFAEGLERTAACLHALAPLAV